MQKKVRMEKSISKNAAEAYKRKINARRVPCRRFAPNEIPAGGRLE